MDDVLRFFRDVLEQLSEMEKSGGITTTGGRQYCSTPVKLLTFQYDWLLSTLLLDRELTSWISTWTKMDA